MAKKKVYVYRIVTRPYGFSNVNSGFTLSRSAAFSYRDSYLALNPKGVLAVCRHECDEFGFFNYFKFDVIWTNLD